jgi:mannose/fructose/N-acetylgalactosamine-specific phosphotransferase system component IIC
MKSTAILGVALALAAFGIAQSKNTAATEASTKEEILRMERDRNVSRHH